MSAQPLGHYEQVRALASAGRLLFVGGVRAGKSSEIILYDAVAGKLLDTAIDVPAHVLALVAQGSLLFAGCADGVVRVFDHAGKSVREIQAHEGACAALAVRDDTLLTGGADGVLRRFSIKSGKQKAEWPLSSRPLRAVAIDPSGTLDAGAGERPAAFAAAGDDGVIRVLSAGDPQRDMPGHDGAVTCLAFTPSDGRLVSGGDDGTVRVWYLVGALESEIRSKDDTVHVGGTLALLFAPASDGVGTSPGTEYGERLVSAGADGKIRIWRMSSRIKPRSFDTGVKALHALTFVPTTPNASSGALVAAGDARTVFGFELDAEGTRQSERAFFLQHGFDVEKERLAAPARATREIGIDILADLDEREAVDLLVAQLASDPEADLRALLAATLAKHRRQQAKKAIRARLDDPHSKVRAAALDALRSLEADSPLSPLRAALESRFADTRIAALRLLPAMVQSSPLATALVTARLSDADAAVRRVALAELVGIFPARASEPLLRAFERGHVDVRAEVLVRAALTGLLADANVAPLIGKALDDDDAEVRRVGFVVSTLQVPSLSVWLEQKDESFAAALAEVIARAAEILGKGSQLPKGADPELAEVVSVSAVFLQTTHPTHGRVSIFKPQLHTPVQAGDRIYLLGIDLSGPAGHLRATDYQIATATVAVSTSEQPEDVRGLLVPAGTRASVRNEADRQPLLAALSCRAPDTALRGARGLALLDDMRALGALLTISREQDTNLRRAAAEALVAFDDPRTKRRLAWMLNDEAAAVRDTALLCFARLEPDPLLVAEAALHASHEDIRVRGLDALSKLDKGKTEVEVLLGDSIEDESPKVRSEAFRTLRSWHLEAPLVPLDRALRARFADLRLLAVHELTTLAKAGDAEATSRLEGSIGDRDANVANTAYDVVLELLGNERASTHLAAIASTHPPLRSKGAKDARKASLEPVRSALFRLLEDLVPSVRTAAIETLDRLLPQEPSALAVGLQSSYLDLRVRTAELLAVRHEEVLLDPMRALLADKELLERLPAALIVPLRQRAATALATLGSPRLLKYFATELIQDDDPIVREQAARGLSNASRRGEEGFLLDLLGHQEIAVRSWAAEGLARLGDARALPVLTGTLRHEHPPIRLGAILSLTALGPEGFVGMLQGLEDPSRDVQRVVLSVILARDLRALRRGETPDLLTSALSSQRPEVRFAAARALELRIVPEQYLAFLVEVLLPDKPDKPNPDEPWPSEEIATRLMVGLAEALAGDRPEQRYAAAQALRLRDRPLVYFREVQRAVSPRSLQKPWVPDTTPRQPAPASDKKAPLALLRQLFAGAESDGAALRSSLGVEEQSRLRLLAFGGYVGLLRQATPDDEAHRVRRDAIERIVELAKAGHVSLPSATPALARALDDPSHLVRQAAFAALKKCYEHDQTALLLALASSSADVIRGALDELATRGDLSAIARALNSNVAQARKYAFDLLEKHSPAGSLDPLLAALDSEHADIRIGVLERLSTSRDSRVKEALGKALESDHEDLRLRAAELLAERRDDRAADALGPWLRAEESGLVARAQKALAKLGSAAAIRTLLARFEDDVTDEQKLAIVGSIGNAGKGEQAGSALEALVGLFDDESAAVRNAAFAAASSLLGPRGDSVRRHGRPKPSRRDGARLARLLTPASRSRYADVRLLAVAEFDDLNDPTTATELLLPLFGDRDRHVRVAAVAAYAKLVESYQLSSAPLVGVLKQGARETMLAAALGLAHAGDPASLRALLLFARAGEEDEPTRALLGLGILGDPRALSELELIAGGGTEEAPASPQQQAAALEALGHLLRALEDDDHERVRDRVESSLGAKDPLTALAAVRALRGFADPRDRERAVSRLIGVLGDDSSDESSLLEAARALGELGTHANLDGAVSKALGKALSHSSANLRWAARWALEELLHEDRTSLELLAVESSDPSIAAPAAAYLASEGDAAVLLSALPALADENLRQRLRFGLLRRDSIAAAHVERLLGEPSAAARADAAWVAGSRSSDGDRSLVPALAAAARQAANRAADAVLSGKPREAEQEQRAWLFALWAVRKLDAKALAAEACAWLLTRQVPTAIRVEAALLLGDDAKGRSALERALLDPEVAVRAVAAARLVPSDAIALLNVPPDVVRLGALAQRSGSLVDKSALAMRSDVRRLLFPQTLAETTLLGELAAEDDADRFDAIALLGRAGTDESIEVLGGLVDKKQVGEIEVRKAAYRALRRAQRLRGKRQQREGAS